MRIFFALRASCFLLATTAIAQVTLSPVSKQIGAGDIVYEILLESDVAAWTATSNAAWLSVSPATGNGRTVLTAKAAKNATAAARTATITIGTAAHTLIQQGTAASGHDLLVVGANSSGQLGTLGYPYVRPDIPGGDTAAIAAGSSHSLFLKTDGSLWITGATPTQIATNVASIAAGGNHSLFIKTDGSLWAMGNNSNGQLGDGTTTNRATPVQIATDVGFVAAGYSHSLFVKTDGSLWAMGNNVSGRLGDGTTTGRSTPVQIATGVTSAAGGGEHSLFIKSDGSLWAMGYNAFGQLGDGTTTSRNSPVQITTGVVSVTAGAAHSSFIKTDGSLWAMGYNLYGSLGDGTTTRRNAPVQIAANVAAVSAGSYHSLFIKADGSVWAAGYNAAGQLGDGTTTNRATPVQVATDVTSVATGDNHSLFVKTDGSTRAMGSFNSGQLGYSMPARSKPTQVITGVTAVAAGATHSLFVRTDGALWAMGANAYGQLGSGTLFNRSAPVPIATDVVTIAAGISHSLFIKTDGSLWAMGLNSSGQLGDGTTTNRFTPVQVATGVVAIAAGPTHSLFIKTDGTLWGMGSNSYGLLGDGTTTSRITPIQIATDVVSANAGQGHSLFIKSDGSLWGMGFNNAGQLGTNLVSQSSTARLIATNVAAVSGGGLQTLFVKNDQTLWATGWNHVGQLGDGTTTSRYSPVQIATGVAAVHTTGSWSNFEGAINLGHTFFVKTDGSLWSMGLNTSGQLGDSSTTDRLAPVQIASGSTNVAVGGSHTLILFGPEGVLTPPPLIVPTLTWTTPAAISYGTALSPAQLNATTSVSGTLTYSPAAGTLLDAGTHTLTASFAPTDTATYATAAITRQLVVTQATPTITWSTPGAIVYGTALSGNQLNASADVPGSFVYSPAAGTVFNAGSLALTATFTPSDSTNYQSASATRSLVITPAPAEITFSNLTATYTGTPHSASATTSPVGLGLAFTYDGGSSAPTIPGSYAVVATISDSNYTGTASDIFVISKGPQSVAFPIIPTQVYGSAPFALEATATSGLPVSFQLISGPASLDGSTLALSGAGTVVVSASQAGNAYYLPAAAIEQSITVAKAAASVTLSNLVQAYNGAARNVSVTTAPSGLSTTIVYNGTAQVPSAAGSYNVTVTILDDNYAGNAYGVLEIVGPPSVTTGDVSQAINEGGSLVLTATPSGLPPFSYQWFKDGEPIDGATGSSLEISNVNASTTGSYTVQVSNAGGTATSPPTTVNVTLKPTLPGDSSTVNAPLGQELVLTMPVNQGTPPFTYQWKKDGEDIPGANSPTLSLPNPTEADSGDYQLYVTNAAGDATSGIIKVILRGAPLVYPFANQVVAPGATAVFTTTFVAAVSADLQWFFDDAPIAGAIDDVLTIENVQLANLGRYHLRVRDAFGEATQSATLKFSQQITFNPLPDVPQGPTPITLRATATSGLPVIFHAYNIAQSGNVITPLSNWGEVLVVAEQAGNELYAPATLVERRFLVISRYETWNQEHFTEAELTDPTISGPAADPDADGLNNLLEYAFGFDPRQTTASTEQEVAMIDAFWHFTYKRPTDRLDLTYQVEASRDLTTWVTSGFVPAKIADDGTYETWRARYITEDDRPVFFRLKVTR